MLKFINQPPRQAGDTLVEVMLAIAIVSLAIAISYAISGKNLNVGITARERTSALGLVQGQIERMKEVEQVNPTSLSGFKNPPIPHFCFDVNDITNNTPVTQSGIDPANNSLSTDASHYTNGASPGSSCVSGGKYYLDVTYIPQGGPPGPNAYGYSFAFSAKWYRAGGGIDQNVTIYYRPW